MARNRGGSESIKKKIAALQRARTEMPTILANTAVNFFKESFRKQGWTDKGFQPWKPRKGELRAGLSRISKNSKSGRSILMKSGQLRNSIHLVYANWKKIRIESDLPYSAIHNQGLTGLAFGKHKFKMPKRKFMGRSYELNNKIREQIEKKLNTVFRKK